MRIAKKDALDWFRFFASMPENRAAAITLDPFNHRFVPCRLTVGKYLDEAAKRKVPVLLMPGKTVQHEDRRGCFLSIPAG